MIEQNKINLLKKAGWRAILFAILSFSFAIMLIFKMSVDSSHAGSQTSMVDVRVSESDDDVEQLSNGSIYFDSSDLEFFNDPNRGDNARVGIRFQNVTVPQGATITDAYLEFVVDEVDDEVTNVTIRAHDTNNAGEFTAAANNVSTRPTTSASTTWNNIPGWTSIGSAQQSPDIKNVVQEVVDRSGWNSGNSMVFVMEGSGRRTAEAYDGSAGQAPLLHIEYTTSPDPTPTSPAGEPADDAYPWQAAAGSPTGVNIGWDYALGYHFTPLADGQITGLGGYFNGTKTVRLFKEGSDTPLVTATVTANNNWSYTSITPITVKKETQYTVAVYLAGSGASYQTNVNMPITSGDIRIDASTFIKTDVDVDARPTNSYTPSMYGQADVVFVTSGDIPTPQPKADLIVTTASATYIPTGCYVPGGTFQVNVTVGNIGQGAAGSFAVTVGNRTVTASGLAAGSTATYSLSNVSGESLTAIVDSGNTVDESNENNNNTNIPIPTPAPPCNAVPDLNTYSSTYAENEDFGSGSIEFSAVTYNHSNGDIVIVEDGNKLFKYSTNTNNRMIPIESSKQAMNITVGSGDTEGIAWMYGTTYAILSENNGQIHIVDLSDYGNGSTIASADHTISTTIPETIDPSNNRASWGAEGVAFKFGSATSDANQTSAIFYVVKEKSNRVLYEVDWDGLTGRDVTINGLNDLSDVYYGAENGEMYIISHESQTVVQLGEINWNANSISVTGKPSVSLDSYIQAEGIAFNADQSTMVVVSETGNLTYGRFTAP